MKRTLLVLALCATGCTRSTERCRVTPLELDFGELPSASGTHQRVVQVTNPSDVDRTLTLSPMSFPFSVDSDVPLPLRAHSGAQLAVRFTPIDGLLHLDELHVSSDDGACDLSVPVRALGSGSIQVSPETIDFTLGAGEEQTKEVVIQNSHRIQSLVFMRWVTPQSGSFNVGFPSVELAVPAGGSVSVPITARAEGWTRVDAEFSIVAPSGRASHVALSITPSSPQLEITPLAFDIPNVGLDLASQPPAFAERTVRVRNTGNSGNPSAPPLRILNEAAPLLGDPDELEVTRPSTPLDLAEGESAELTVRLVPMFPGQRTWGFHIATDHFQPVLVRLNALAQVLPPCELRVEPTGVLELQDAADGGLEGMVTFTNTGPERCVVDNLRLQAGTSPQFAIVWPTSAQVELQPGREQRVLIAGPKDAGVGTIGAFGFHVFRPNSDNEWLELRVGP